MNSSKSRRIALGVLTALGLVMSAPPARASLLDGPHVVTCLGSEVATFTPGLKVERQRVSTTIKQVLPVCFGDVSISSASSFLAFTAEQACVNPSLPPTTNGSETITWNSGEKSTFVYTKTYTQQDGQLVAVKTGSISEGKYRDATAVMTLLAVSDVTACASPEGNTENTALVQFVITIK